MTPEELEKLVENDPSVKSAANSLAVAKAKLDSAIAARDAAYAYWQEKEREVGAMGKLTPPGLANQKRLLRDKAKADYFTKRDLATTAQTEYDSAVKIYNQVKQAANDRIVAQASAVQQSEVAASQASQAQSNASATFNVAKLAQTQKESIAEKLKANKVYIIGAIVLIIVVTVAVIAYKKYKS